MDSRGNCALMAAAACAWQLWRDVEPGVRLARVPVGMGLFGGLEPFLWLFLALHIWDRRAGRLCKRRRSRRDFDPEGRRLLRTRSLTLVLLAATALGVCCLSGLIWATWEPGEYVCGLNAAFWIRRLWSGVALITVKALLLGVATYVYPYAHDGEKAALRPPS